MWLESGIPGTGFQEPPISESQSLNLFNGTPVEKPLIFIVTDVLDCTESLNWRVRFTRQTQEGWEGTPGVQLSLGECPLGIRSPGEGTKRAWGAAREGFA